MSVHNGQNINTGGTTVVRKAIRKEFGMHGLCKVKNT